MRATLQRVTKDGSDVKTFWFSAEKKFDYVAGQFIELTLPHQNADQRGEKRWFTLASSPTEPFYAISTRISARSSSFKKALTGLQPGATFVVSAPMGDFVLPKDPSRPLTFIAAGIGITPFRSMVKWLYDTQEERSLNLVCINSNEQDVPHQSTLEQCNAGKYILKLSPGTLEERSKVGKQAADSVSYHANKLIYVAGPEQLVETVRDHLLTKRFSREQIVTDFFHGY